MGNAFVNVATFGTSEMRHIVLGDVDAFAFTVFMMTLRLFGFYTQFQLGNIF